MAHILFVTPYYPPEKGAAQVRISENAQRLVRRGHDVTVLTTFPNYPTGIVPQQYRHKLLQHEVAEGVHVVRVWSYAAPHRGLIRRLLAQLSFACLAPLLGARAVGQQDLLIVQSPPLFDAIAGRVLAWLKHCPFIFMVSDLWPESAIQLDAVHNKLFIFLAQWLEWSTYQKACAVWALSKGIRDRLILHGLAPEHVFLLTNGADTHRFRPLPQKAARKALGWRDTFTVLYAGTHGASHGLGTVLDAAEALQDYRDIQILFVGDGSEKASLVTEAQGRALSNVAFLDALPHERLPLALAAADVCLVPMRNVPLFRGRLPLKMFEIMAAGRPILLGVDGEARKLAVSEARSALYVEPENAAALAEGVLYLKEHPEEARELGKRGRAYIEQHYEREDLAGELEEHIVGFVDSKEKPRHPRKRRVTVAMLQALLIGGDTVAVLLALVLSLTMLPSISPITQWSSLLTMWNVGLTWLCIPFLFWCVSAKIAQAQKLTNAATRLQSICSVECALLLTSLLWYIVVLPFAGSHHAAYLVVLPCFLLFGTVVFCIWRLLFASMLTLPALRTKAIIVGANDAGNSLAQEFRRALRTRTTLLGYIHEGPDQRPIGDDLPILGGRNVLQKLIEQRALDTIITAVSYEKYPDLFRCVLAATQQGITIAPMTIVYEHTCGKLPVEYIGDQWYASLPTESTTSVFYNCWHRGMDILFGCIGLLVLLCALPVLAPLICFNSPGPIFYHQERLGYRGKKFSVHKFRSMHVNAEYVGQAQWAKQRDPRVTGIGRFLRATHLDELPQVLNILRGEMSLIGPRPERQEFVVELEKTIPYYRYRLLIKPGLTGWAQVKHPYTNTEQEALVKSQYDLYYIRHQSFLLDISILLRTVQEVLFRRGV